MLEMNRYLTSLCFVACVVVAWTMPIRAEDASAAPLPTTVFKNLQAGKKQTVIAYGTSLTHQGAWTGEFGRFFTTQFPDQVTFKNAAQSGKNSKWALANFEERVLAHRPDLVLIEFSINDAVTRGDISLAESKANLDKMVKALRQQNPKVDIVLQTMNPVWDSPKKASASERPNLEAYYEVYRSYAREHSLPLVDNYVTWRAMQKDDPEKFQKVVPDGTHPNNSASQWVTGRAVKELLKKAQAAAISPSPSKSGKR
ncbi:MAG: hypothetical protein K0R17_3792 [Rariglobus sp.]|jgi:lysophospholipase L1-like esterase|nr:hypothetical protein [Rariglobus sp.]